MPILQTYGGARGFGRGGLVPFAATGGSQVLTQNGWRYHLFTASGTFTVVSGAATLSVLRIRGGSNGQAGFLSGSTGFGGAGREGGASSLQVSTAPVASSFSVVVGGAGGNSFADILTNNVLTIESPSGGTGAGVTAGFVPSLNRNSAAGNNLALYNTRAVPWSLLSLSQAANAGGGGGGAYGRDDGEGYFVSAAQSAGGTSGYNSAIGGAGGGSGGGPSTGPSAGASAAANSGGGGGGGGGRITSFYGGSISFTGAAGGNGGSGFVIVAYPVA